MSTPMLYMPASFIAGKRHLAEAASSTNCCAVKVPRVSAEIVSAAGFGQRTDDDSPAHGLSKPAAQRIAVRDRPEVPAFTLEFEQMSLHCTTA
jgi:hypothetical protein